MGLLGLAACPERRAIPLLASYTTLNRAAALLPFFQKGRTETAATELCLTDMEPRRRGSRIPCAMPVPSGTDKASALQDNDFRRFSGSRLRRRTGLKYPSASALP